MLSSVEKRLSFYAARTHRQSRHESFAAPNKVLRTWRTIEATATLQTTGSLRGSRRCRHGATPIQPRQRHDEPSQQECSTTTSESNAVTRDKRRVGASGRHSGSHGGSGCLGAPALSQCSRCIPYDPENIARDSSAIGKATITRTKERSQFKNFNMSRSSWYVRLLLRSNFSCFYNVFGVRLSSL